MECFCFRSKQDTLTMHYKKENSLYLGQSKSSGGGTFYSCRKLGNLLCFYQQIDRLSLYLFMLWVNPWGKYQILKRFFYRRFFRSSVSTEPEKNFAQKRPWLLCQNVWNHGQFLDTTKYCQINRVKTSWKFIHRVCFVERLTLIIFVKKF